MTTSKGSFNKTKSFSALKLKFTKWGKYGTTKRCFKQFYENNVFLKRYNKNYFRSANCYSYASRYIYVQSSQHDKLLQFFYDGGLYDIETKQINGIW